jgi:rhodanese-related sulfurtransferase
MSEPKGGTLQHGVANLLRMAGDHAFHADDVDVSPEWVREHHESGEIQLIDVREPYEWDAGRLAGARHIELERVASQADTIDRDKPVVFYCRIGARSTMAAHAFRRAGWEAYSLAGGLEAWDDDGLPLEPEGGHVAPH